jgi:high-affinity iron transporter
MWLVLSACEPSGALPPTADVARGRLRYLVHCALCHGERADGRGVRREGMSPTPADFTSRGWRDRMSPRTVFAVIRDGKRGTPMPAWPALSDQEIWDLTAYVLSVGDAR